MTWLDDAACAGHDPNLFATPDAGSGRTVGRDFWDFARAVCGGCPVKAECLRDGHEHGDDHTMRGGLTPDERHDLHGPPKGAPMPFPHGTERGAMRHRRRREKVCPACHEAAGIARRAREVLNPRVS